MIKDNIVGCKVKAKCELHGEDLDQCVGTGHCVSVDKNSTGRIVRIIKGNVFEAVFGLQCKHTKVMVEKQEFDKYFEVIS